MRSSAVNGPSALNGNVTGVNNLTGAGTGNLSGFGNGTFTGIVQGGTLQTTTGGVVATGSQVTVGTVPGNQTMINNGTVTAVTLNATTGNIATVNSTTTNTGTVNATTGNIATVNSTTVNTGTANAGTVNATTGNIANVNATTVKTVNLAVAPGGTVDLGGNRVQNVATPIAGTDAVNKNYVDEGLNEAFKKIDKATQGVAIAIALGGITLPQGKSFAIGANVGFFENKQAFAAQTAIRLTEVLTFNGGVGFGFNSGGVGGRVGISAAW